MRRALIALALLALLSLACPSGPGDGVRTEDLDRLSGCRQVESEYGGQTWRCP